MKRFSMHRIVYFVITFLLSLPFLLLMVFSISTYYNDTKTLVQCIFFTVGFVLWPMIILIYLGFADFIYGYRIAAKEIPKEIYPIHRVFHVFALVNTYLLVFFLFMLPISWNWVVFGVILFLFLPPTVTFWFLTFIYKMFHPLYDREIERKEANKTEKIQREVARKAEQEKKAFDKKVQAEKNRQDVESRKNRLEHKRAQKQKERDHKRQEFKNKREKNQEKRNAKRAFRKAKRKYKKDVRSYEKLIQKYKKEREEVREELRKNRWRKIGGILVNEKEGLISFNEKEYRYSEIKSTKLIRETHTERASYNWHSGSSKRHPSIGGMLVGAVFAGFIGAMLGGNSRSRTSHSGYSGGHTSYDRICHYLAVKVTLGNDIQDIVFIQGGKNEASVRFRELLHDAEITKQELDRLSRTPEPQDTIFVEDEPEYRAADMRVKDLEKYFNELKQRGPQV